MEQQQLIHTFKIDDHIFALPLSSIDQIIRASSYTLVPNAPKGIQGILNYHGKLIPLIDLRIKLGLPKKEISIEDRIVLVKTAEKRIAILVSDALSILPMDRNKAFNTTELTGKKDLEMLTCINQEVAFVYNPEHLVSQEEFASLEESISITHPQKQTA